MTDLSIFTPEEQELLISLPYRAGVWVSYAEDEDGEMDDTREMKALEFSIREVAKLHEGQSLVGALVLETMKRKADWHGWAEHCFNVPVDAQKALRVLNGKVSETELKNYHALVMEIASTVAQAYGEFGEFEEEQDEGLLSGIIGKIVGGFAGKDTDEAGHPMNVSAAEDSALSNLSKALQGL